MSTAASSCSSCHDLLLVVAERSESLPLIGAVVRIGIDVLNLGAALRSGVLTTEEQVAVLDGLIDRLDAAGRLPSVGRQHGRLIVAAEELRRARASVSQRPLAI